MTMDLTKPIHKGSRAWCSEAGCSWAIRGEWSHRDGQAHSAMLGHVVHCYEPEEVCGAAYIGGFSNVWECSREPGHDGEHRSAGGAEWAQ
jgi:hypothetical protein